MGDRYRMAVAGVISAMLIAKRAGSVDNPSSKIRRDHKTRCASDVAGVATLTAIARWHDPQKTMVEVRALIGGFGFDGMSIEGPRSVIGASLVDATNDSIVLKPSAKGALFSFTIKALCYGKAVGAADWDIVVSLPASTDEGPTAKATRHVEAPAANKR